MLASHWEGSDGLAPACAPSQLINGTTPRPLARPKPRVLDRAGSVIIMLPVVMSGEGEQKLPNLAR